MRREQIREVHDMLVLKYEKRDGARFISHIDLLRHSSRIIRRAQIPVRFSNGFNPHALVFFSPPLALGVSSVAEYISIDADITKEEIFNNYNAAVSDGLKAVAVFECAQNPNLQGRAWAADYVFPIDYTPIDLSDGFYINYIKKDKTVTEDVSDKIFAVENFGGRLLLRLAAGNVNLRPDRVLDRLNETLGTSVLVTQIEKIKLYVTVGEKHIDADEYLNTLKP